MSTRSCTVVKTTLGAIALYRHCDGYPAEAGAAIIEAIRTTWERRAAQDFDAGERLVEELLRLRYDATAFRAQTPIYELTTKPEDHDDLEWVYRIEHVSGPTYWRVMVEQRASFEPEEWGKVELGLEVFTKLVNNDRDQINGRRAKLKLEGVYDHVEPVRAVHP